MGWRGGRKVGFPVGLKKGERKGKGEERLEWVLVAVGAVKEKSVERKKKRERVEEGGWWG